MRFTPTRPNRPMRLIAIASLGLSLACAAWAHHSQAEFDFKSVVEVAGTVKELDWRSPHARLYVDVLDDRGNVVNWNFELPSPMTLMRRGWKRDSPEARRKGDGERRSRPPLSSHWLPNCRQGCRGQAAVHGCDPDIRAGTKSQGALMADHRCASSVPAGGTTTQEMKIINAIVAPLSGARLIALEVAQRLTVAPRGQNTITRATDSGRLISGRE